LALLSIFRTKILLLKKFSKPFQRCNIIQLGTLHILVNH
jgi:hypothetical protein